MEGDCLQRPQREQEVGKRGAEPALVGHGDRGIEQRLVQEQDVERKQNVEGFVPISVEEIEGPSYLHGCSFSKRSRC